MKALALKPTARQVLPIWKVYVRTDGDVEIHADDAVLQGISLRTEDHVFQRVVVQVSGQLIVWRRLD